MRKIYNEGSRRTAPRPAARPETRFPRRGGLLPVPPVYGPYQPDSQHVASETADQKRIHPCSLYTETAPVYSLTLSKLPLRGKPYTANLPTYTPAAGYAAAGLLCCCYPAAVVLIRTAAAAGLSGTGKASIQGKVL
jgi:hypothetical protein